MSTKLSKKDTTLWEEVKKYLGEVEGATVDYHGHSLTFFTDAREEPSKVVDIGLLDPDSGKSAIWKLKTSSFVEMGIIAETELTNGPAYILAEDALPEALLENMMGNTKVRSDVDAILVSEAPAAAAVAESPQDTSLNRWMQHVDVSNLSPTPEPINNAATRAKIVRNLENYPGLTDEEKEEAVETAMAINGAYITRLKSEGKKIDTYDDLVAALQDGEHAEENPAANAMNAVLHPQREEGDAVPRREEDHPLFDAEIMRAMVDSTKEHPIGFIGEVLAATKDGVSVVDRYEITTELDKLVKEGIKPGDIAKLMRNILTARKRGSEMLLRKKQRKGKTVDRQKEMAFVRSMKVPRGRGRGSDDD